MSDRALARSLFVYELLTNHYLRRDICALGSVSREAQTCEDLRHSYKGSSIFVDAFSKTNNVLLELSSRHTHQTS